MADGTLPKLILAGCMVFFISFIIHMPMVMQQSLFGRVLFQPIYSDTVASTIQLFGKGVPFLDYPFQEAPVLGLVHGLLVSAATILGGLEPAVIYYLLFSWIVFTSYMLVIYFYDKLLRHYRGKSLSRYDYLYILFPSFIIYLNYDFTPIILVTLLAGLFYIVKGKLFTGYLLVSLMSLMSLLGLVIMVYLLYHYSRRRMKNDLLNLLFSIIVVLGGLLAWLILLPYSAQSFTNLAGDLFCKNCILLLTLLKPGSQYMGALGISVIYAVTVLFLLLTDPEDRRDAALYSGFLYMSVIVFGLNFVPQNMLYILILLPLLTQTISLRKSFLTLLLADIANISIILLWFHDQQIRSFLGLPAAYNPWSLSSPVQWIAQARNILVAALLILSYRGLFVHHNSKENRLITPPI